MLMRFGASKAHDPCERAGSAGVAARRGQHHETQLPGNHGSGRSAVRCGPWCAGHHVSIGSGSPEAIRCCCRPPRSAWTLSFEWYFRGGYVSAALFNKDLKNIITTGDQTFGQITLDGQTVDVVYNGQVNQTTADLHGFELAYQQFYDQLPGWMSHLGIQANYTNIQAKADPPGMGVDAERRRHPGRSHHLTSGLV